MLGKYLDINTSHLKEETLNSLSENKMPYSYDYKEGIFISVPDKDIIGEEVYELPSDLVTLLEYAWKNDVLLIRLDADGEVVDDLPVYEWDEVSGNEVLAKKIFDCLSDGCDDEEYREETIRQLEGELDVTSCYITDVIKKLCEQIEELEE